MKKFFYSHIIEIDSVLVELDKMNLSQEQKEHLVDLIESHMHQVILDLILSELSDEDKKTFLQHLIEEKHDDLWIHLQSRIEKIEEKIKSAAQDVKEDLHNDIKDVHASK
jgi:hypothetical protein